MGTHAKTYFHKKLACENTLICQNIQANFPTSVRHEAKQPTALSFPFLRF